LIDRLIDLGHANFVVFDLTPNFCIPGLPMLSQV